VGRYGKGKNRITERGRTMVMSARIDVWRGIDKRQVGRANSVQSSVSLKFTSG